MFHRNISMEHILVTKKSEDYELIDSGNGEKLERYGGMILSRPDPQAIWSKSLNVEEWQKADAIFVRTGQTGKWNINKEPQELWIVSLYDIKFSLKLLPSKHLGVFPEQSANWQWLFEKIKKETEAGKKISVLNMFGYTGGATLASAKAGAEVVHLDSSEFAVDMAHENLKLSGLAEASVRFIVDDAKKFVEREINRGNKYDVVVMDPPVYGKGLKNKVWNIEDDLTPLMSRIKNILTPEPLALLLNGYASGYSALTYSQVLSEATKDLKGEMSFGELAIEENSGRLLSSGIFARFEK